MKKIIIACALVLVACSGISIPTGYQGKFSATNGSLGLVMESGKVTLQSSSGVAVPLSIQNLKAEPLLKGKAGAYVASSSDKMIDLYLVVPDMSTRQEAEGLVWFNAEIAIAAIEPKQKMKQANLGLLHCNKGMVLIDSASKQVQVGCGDGAEELVLTRQQ